MRHAHRTPVAHACMQVTHSFAIAHSWMTSVPLRRDDVVRTCSRTTLQMDEPWRKEYQKWRLQWVYTCCLANLFVFRMRTYECDSERPAVSLQPNSLLPKVVSKSNRSCVRALHMLRARNNDNRNVAFFNNFYRCSHASLGRWIGLLLHKGGVAVECSLPPLIFSSRL